MQAFLVFIAISYIFNESTLDSVWSKSAKPKEDFLVIGPWNPDNVLGDGFLALVEFDHTLSILLRLLYLQTNNRDMKSTPYM